MGNFGASITKTTYLFVDGSNFRKYYNEATTKWFGQEVEFDFQRIKDFFQAEKAFYYDCIDDIRNENEAQQECDLRAKLQEEQLNKIRAVEGCHVHLGSISGKNKKKRQKEVDVMLAVQMMEHAFRGNMQKAVLLSGDKDFRPLVESLVRLGLFVEVVGDKNHISQDLIHSADSHKKLNVVNYHKWTEQSYREINPLNIKLINFSSINSQSSKKQLVKSGMCGNHNVEFFSTTNSHGLNEGDFILYSNILGDNDSALFIQHTPPHSILGIDFEEPKDIVENKSFKNLNLYFELLYAQINWDK